MAVQLEQQLTNRISNWKKNLIDMSKRNTLLNFKPKKTNSIKFLDEPSGLFQLLVDDEQSINTEKLATQYSLQIDKTKLMAIDDLEKKKRIAEETQSFKKILNKIRTAAKTRMNEQGINISYLSFGLLQWKETQTAKSSEVFFAPLLLVPATLKRTSANDPFSLNLFEDDIVINPFLAHMLREQHGINLPELPEDSSKIDVHTLWEEVRDLIINLEGWTVEGDVYLSLFSFNRLVMYKDMENYKDLIENHPLIREIAGVSDEESRKQTFDHTRIPDESSLDREISSSDLFNILDADSSQQQAIIAAKNSMSFVLQGPPGTGKSQTISNIIAENLANNKKVLFVSEKMSALSVVKSRLEAEGLGDFCLEMHSQKANKRQVLDELNHVLNKQKSNKKIPKEVYSQINVIREKLNTYVDIVHLSREPYGRTVYEVHGTLAKQENIPELMVNFNIEPTTELESIYRLLSDLERYRDSVYQSDFQPWEGFNDENYSLELKSQVKAYLTELSKQFGNTKKVATEIEAATKLKVTSLNELKTAINILDMVMQSPMPPIGWFDKKSIVQIITDAKNYQESFSNFLDEKKQLIQEVNENILNEQLPRIYKELFTDNEKFITMLPESLLLELLIFNKSGLLIGIGNFLKNLEEISGFKGIAMDLGIPQLENLADLKQLSLYVSLLILNIKPTAEWFNESKFTNIINDALTTKNKYLELETSQQKLLSKYKPTFLEINADKVLVDLQVKESMLDSFLSDQRSVDVYLYNHKSKISNVFNDFFNKIKLFNTYKTEFETLFGIELLNVYSVENLELAIKIIERNPRPQDSWFNPNNYHSIQSTIRESKELYGKYLSEYSKATNHFEEEIYDEKIHEIFERCKENYQTFLRVVNTSYKKDLKWLKGNLKSNEKVDFDSFHKYVRNVKRVMDYRESIKLKEIDMKTSLGLHYQDSETNWSKVEQAFSDINELVEWHQGRSLTAPLRELLVRPAGKVEQLTTSFGQIKQLCNELKRSMKVIQNEFPNMVHLFGNNTAMLNTEELHSKLKVEWTNVDSYFKYIDEFSSYHQNPTSLSVLDLKNDLRDVITLKQLTDNLEIEFQNKKKSFGDSFKGKETNWDKLFEYINHFETLFSGKTVITQKFQNAILIGENFKVNEPLLKKCLNSLEKEMPKFKESLPSFFAEYGGPEKYWPINAFGEKLSSLEHSIETWHNRFETLSSHFLSFNLSFDDIRKLVKKAARVIELKGCIDGELEKIQTIFGDKFTGYSTNWERIFDALAWTDEWHELFANQKMPSELMGYVSAGGDGNKNKLKICLAEAEKEYEKSFNLQKDFHLYFSISIIFKDNDYSNLVLSELISFSDLRLGSIDLLEDWIRYKRLEKRGIDLGLGHFMSAIKMKKIEDFSFKELFQKRFFKLWLDQVYKMEPLLYEFDADAMNTDVTAFRKLDKSSNQFNVQRINERLESNRDHAINSLAYRRELQVMQAEIGKKKRHYAIRKLLNMTAPLFMEIKPCLLMSPLSVSQFLDASVIQFDLVIFDEASQIFSEDAVGSIVRGKQVIIVGDTKQLPPTNFFHSSMIEEDFDEDQEEEQDVTYESILDECANVLPSINLRWHYRSKHESLITFSNQAFYHNSLITFPSSDNGQYLGTEFVYVENGVYDRGSSGNNTNQREAETIAHLVFEHFKDHSAQSLGVIAFSEKQASAIETELLILRNTNPLFERFFQEGAHEEFFIKSLENVQGDERDVIFLSIGYAKAADQTLHYNFGPLSKARGERRLNVAVTRAKYHMKLISSLRPSELLDTKINSNTGLKLLKDYMQTAMDGKLPISMTSHSEKEFDSPFEEDVYNAIIEMGFKVETQIGCSGYRIDLAVIDPLDNNKFILGIECDGKAYHSSKVARDRDRLRQQVLEGLGWKIYRIWSQEWFKKKKFEITRLRSYLEKTRY
jgi:superfamily I DNA and/or RNA helicase/very-short-patch-repair endonuclease